MTPEEIMQAYDVLVQEGNQYAAQEAAKIGNSQASLGLMAERVARPTNTTSGLANYTYDRTMRPTVDSLATGLAVSGKSQALDRYLKDELMKAKNAYEDAKNSYTTAATTPKTNGNGGNGNHTEKVYGGSGESGASQIPYTEKGTVIGTGTSGDGVYDVIVADGKGGFTRHQYFAKSGEEAREKYYAQYGRPGMKEGASSSASSGSGGQGSSGGGGGGGGGGGR